MDVIASAAFGIDGDSFTNANSDFTRLVERLFLPHNLSLLETTALLFSPLLGRLMGYRYKMYIGNDWTATNLLLYLFVF